MKKMISVAVLDSGIRLSHADFKSACICGYSLIRDDYGKYSVCNDFNDVLGHGTAVTSIIARNTSNIKITCIKVFKSELRIEAEAIIAALEYIYQNEYYDIINISLGITVCKGMTRLYDVCLKLRLKGMIVVSAFDNMGAISYPAAFDCVIGVDASSNCIKINDFEFVEGSPINLFAKGGLQRVAWLKPDYIIAGGSSFSCAYVTAKIVEIMQSGITEAKKILDIFHGLSHIKYSFTAQLKKQKLCIDGYSGKTAVFPFNKEIHSFVRYSDLLKFDIVDFYDTKYSGNVGAYTTDILCIDSNATHIKKKSIKNISSIDWDSFETLILGHCASRSDFENLIREAISRGKNIYSFDPVPDTWVDEDYTGMVYYPGTAIDFDYRTRFGKLHVIGTPVIAVFGTSSRQGKFSIQLELKRRFIADGYKVGHLSTEPSGFAFGASQVYHCGYNASVDALRDENMVYINELLHRIDEENNDIILLGGQSSVLPSSSLNIKYFGSVTTNG